MIGAFRRTFSRKFRKIRIFLAEKVLSDVFQLSRNAAVNFCKLAVRMKKNSAWGLRIGSNIIVCERSANHVHEERFVGAADGVANVCRTFQHSLGQELHHELFQHVQWEERTRHKVRLRRPHAAQRKHSRLLLSYYRTTRNI